MTPLERYYTLRKKGLCGQCGKMPATKGCRCEFCNDVHKERNRRRKQPYRDGKPKYQARKECGVCVTCGVPIDRFVRCLRCRERVNASVQKGRVIWMKKYDTKYRVSLVNRGAVEFYAAKLPTKEERTEA